jgi:hypothetical protein
MLTRAERIVHSCLLGGFLCAEIAWHQHIFSKAGVVPWQALVYFAGILWAVALAEVLWTKRSMILQQEVQGWPPWYYILLSVPLCIYIAITPWFLLEALLAIRSPIS